MCSKDFSQSLFLNNQNDVICGRDLIKVFNDLRINIGGVTKLTIESWFDTDCEEIKEFLNCLSVYVNCSNALTAQEIAEYEELVENGLLLQDQEYETLLSQMNLNYPEILDCENNVFELECMKDELEMIQKEDCNVVNLLDFNKNFRKKIVKEIKKYGELEIVSVVQNSEINEKCMKLSYHLDETGEKSEQKICRYSGYLNEFDYTDRPTFLFNSLTIKYDQYCLDIVSRLNVVFKHKNEDLSKMDILTKSVKKRLSQYYSNDNPVNELEILRQRIFTSNQNYIIELLQEEKLKAEIICLKDNLEKILEPYEEGHQFLLEASIFSKGTLLDQILSDIKNVIQIVHNQIIDEPKIHLNKNLILIKRKHLENLITLHTKTTEICIDNFLFYMLLVKEKYDIESTDKSFRDFYFYITNNMHNLQSRIELMNEAINKHRLFDSLPVNQKLKLVDIIKKLITNCKQDNSDTTITHLIDNFNEEYLKLEQKIVFEDFDTYYKSCLEIEKEIYVLRKFINNGPTMQIMAIPHTLVEEFKKIENLFDIVDKNLKYTMDVFNDAKKKLSKSKWLKIRRQLWMFFLVEPQKLHTAITCIESAVKEVNKKRA